MSHLDPSRATSPGELRKFGLLVGGAFLALSAITFFRHKPPGVYYTFGTLGAALVVMGAIAPAALGPVYTGWMKFALALSKVTTPIFMGAIYFVVLTPMGLMMRAFGKRPLGQPDGNTFWVARPVGERASTLERQF